ncbi:MAG: hypothetical protein WEC58_00975, partial [Candidatus Paceibacterota bacterium]
LISLDVIPTADIGELMPAMAEKRDRLSPTPVSRIAPAFAKSMNDSCPKGGAPAIAGMSTRSPRGA